MSEINYKNLIELGFKDLPGNGWGCQIDIDNQHEIKWYLQDNTIRYQTKGSGFTRVLNCINLSDVEFIYRIFTGKSLPRINQDLNHQPEY